MKAKDWAEVDVVAVRRAMERSMRGNATPEDMRLCERAWRIDVERYGELHREVKDDAIAALNPLWKREES